MASSSLQITIYIPRDTLNHNDDTDVVDHIKDQIEGIVEEEKQETGDLNDITVHNDGWS